MTSVRRGAFSTRCSKSSTQAKTAARRELIGRPPHHHIEHVIADQLNGVELRATAANGATRLSMVLRARHQTAPARVCCKPAE